MCYYIQDIDLVEVFNEKISEVDRRFWAAIGIGSGLSTFFFGINSLDKSFGRGWITVIAALILMIAGFVLATKKSNTDKT
jgi:hypothetical protein